MLASGRHDRGTMSRYQRTRDVHVRAVDVVPGRQIPSLLAVGADGLLAGPWLVPPGEEDEEQLVDDVRVGHVEVVF